MRKINGNFPKTAYKSKVLKFKLGEVLPQRRIYFITFKESPEITFSKYKETCEVLLDYTTIVGEGIKDYVKKTIRNLQHENIDVHIIRLLA